MSFVIDIIDVPKGAHHANRSHCGSTAYDNGNVYISKCRGSSVASSLYGKELFSITVEVIPGILEIQVQAWEGGEIYAEACKVLENMPKLGVHNTGFESDVNNFVWAKTRAKKTLNWEGILKHIFDEGVKEGKSQKATEFRKLLEI